MNAPSQTPEAAGLEVVAWSSEEYLADTRARKHGAYWMWGNPASSASVALVTAASAQAAIDAEKARADRLAKALERIAQYREEPGGPPPDDEMQSIARAALQQETQP